MIKQGQGSMFVQDVSHDAFWILTCVAASSVGVPRGDRTIRYCPDLKDVNGFRPSGFIQGEAGEYTASLERPLDDVKNTLLELDCAFQARFNWGCRGDRTNPANYVVGFWLYNALLGDGAIDGAIVREPGENDETPTSADLGALDGTFVYRMSGKSQSHTATMQNINDIAFLPPECESDCGDRILEGEVGYAVCNSDRYLYYQSGYGEVIYTDDGGSTWEAVSGEPFGDAWTEDLLSLVLLSTGEGHRIIVGREGIPALNPQVSYSDDGGESWTTQSLPAGNLGGGVNDMERDVVGRIWAVSDNGYVYRSDNQGQAWSEYEGGSETSEDLNAIAFHPNNERLGYAVGDNNAFIYTIDGSDFSAGVGPAAGVALKDVDVNIFGHIYVTTADARLFRSLVSEPDAADDWEEVLDLENGTLDNIMFDYHHDYFGFMNYNDVDGEGHVYRSEDGGKTWLSGTNTPVGVTPDNSGLYALWANSPNMVYSAGNVDPTYPEIVKFQRRG